MEMTECNIVHYFCFLLIATSDYKHLYQKEVNNDKLDSVEQFFIYMYKYKGKITISDSGREICEIHMLHVPLHLVPKFCYLTIAV